MSKSRSDDHEAITVTHDPAAQRFTAAVDGQVAVCDYRLEGNRMIFTHTLVPPELRGRGLAERLVRAGLQLAAEEKRVVVPACSYVATFIARHREFASLLESARPGR